MSNDNDQMNFENLFTETEMASDFHVFEPEFEFENRTVTIVKRWTWKITKCLFWGGVRCLGI